MLRLLSVFVAGLFCLFVIVGSARAAEDEASRFSPRQKVLMLNLGAVGAIAAWGLISWDYGSSSPHMDQEGWFGQGTPEGGGRQVGAHVYQLCP
jgi:hypothetical protein